MNSKSESRFHSMAGYLCIMALAVFSFPAFAKVTINDVIIARLRSASPSSSEMQIAAWINNELSDKVPLDLGAFQVVYDYFSNGLKVRYRNGTVVFYRVLDGYQPNIPGMFILSLLLQNEIHLDAAVFANEVNAFEDLVRTQILAMFPDRANNTRRLVQTYLDQLPTVTDLTQWTWREFQWLSRIAPHSFSLGTKQLEFLKAKWNLAYLLETDGELLGIPPEKRTLFHAQTIDQWFTPKDLTARIVLTLLSEDIKRLHLESSLKRISSKNGPFLFEVNALPDPLKKSEQVNEGMKHILATLSLAPTPEQTGNSKYVIDYDYMTKRMAPHSPSTLDLLYINEWKGRFLMELREVVTRIDREICQQPLL